MQHIISIPNFSLSDTLCCGQCFRFSEQVDGSYTGIVQNQSVRIAQKGDQLILRALQFPTDFWENYFDLQTDYEQILSRFDGDPVLETARAKYGGIRILRQDGWEALISFILSSNTHIPRIRGMIQRLCELLGEPIPGGHAFPTPSTLARCSEKDLVPVRAGFRTRYILDAAKKVDSGEIVLDQLKDMPIDQARETLLNICGVGEKVAECTLLFGFHRLEAFPVDVWMKKALQNRYPDGLSRQALSCPGIAQQLLFYQERLEGHVYSKTY